MPAAGRNGQEEYEKAHIPGAVFFDQDKIADKESGLPHTLPSPEFFAQQAGTLGITADETVVVYDGPGMLLRPARLVDVPRHGREECLCSRWRIRRLEKGGLPRH
ncbi:rhodanese-like domain-containing protein [Brucella abortus]|nr:rhodanese-like domain-containing protein [Brucella abortus]